ncbi:MAG: DMT family transporter [Firmicutes bacterium]|nr:DMT family transporter [Bacillota bacterium]
MSKAYIFVVITAFLFGSMEVSCKIGGADLDAFQLTFLRFAIGGLVLLPFAVIEMRRRGVRIHGKDVLQLAGVGALGIPVSMVLFQLSIMSSNASTVSVLICTSPFFVMLFAHLFTDEKLNRDKLIVLAIALIGILFMLRPWDVQEGNSMLGMVLMLLAALFFGAYTVAGKTLAARMGLMAQTSFSFLIGSAILLVIILCMGRPVLTGVAEHLPIVLYVGVMVTGVGYFCYFKAIELSDAATGSFAFFLKPAIAPTLARIILKETILWNTFVGIGLILAASLLNILSQKKRMSQQRAAVRRRKEVGSE